MPKTPSPPCPPLPLRERGVSHSDAAATSPMWQQHRELQLPLPLWEGVGGWGMYFARAFAPKTLHLKGLEGGLESGDWALSYRLITPVMVNEADHLIMIN